MSQEEGGNSAQPNTRNNSGHGLGLYTTSAGKSHASVVAYCSMSTSCTMGEFEGTSMQAEDPTRGREPRNRSGVRTRTRLLRIGAVAACWIACIVVAIAYWNALAEAWNRIYRAHWAAVSIVVPMFILWNHAASVGWRTLLEGLAPGLAPTSWRLTLIRIQGQAVNLVVPLFGLSGDLTRSFLLTRERTNLAVGAPSVALDSMASLTAGLIFTVAGVSLRGAALPGGALSLATLGAVAAGTMAALHAVPSLARRLSRVAWFENRPQLNTTLRLLADPEKALRSSIHKSIGWHLLERCLMAAEIWVVVWSLGLGLSLAQTLFSTAVLTASSLFLFFVPGQIGAAEGGLSLAFVALGLPAEVGLGAALIRRARQLLFMCAGLIWLGVSRSRQAVRVGDPRPAPSTGS